jgi:hypothetical protein
MVTLKHILLALLIVIAGSWAAFRFLENDERKVKKQFAQLSEWVSKEPGESPIVMAQKVKNIGSFMSESCEIKIPIDSFSGKNTREEVSAYAARGRSYFSTLDLKFYDLTISIPEKGVATVTLTARLTGTSTGGEHVEETRELRCVLKKTERKWFFTELEVVEVLKK